MKTERVRGSELLKQRWSEDELAQLVDVDQDGVELVKLFPRGIPVPDGVSGTFHVHRDALGELIAYLTKGAHVPHIWVGPIGTPWPDRFEVGIEAGSVEVGA